MENEDGSPPSERYMPVEVNKALRERWRARHSTQPVPGEYRLTLNDLLSAYHYDSEKERLFGIHRSDQLMYDISDRLLETVIEEIQDDGATVVGLLFRIIQEAMEIYPPFRKQLLGPVLHHARSSEEVRAEIRCVSGTLKRLQQEFERATTAEAEHGAKADPS